MGITTVKLVSQKLLMKKPVWTGLKPVYAQLSDIIDSQERYGYIKS